ncbi:MAG: hypothetical protein E6677_02130, partial [Finegoldia magna]|nr:hypothetical protein [Finegoldia magna]
GATTGITNNKYKMIKDAPIGFTTEDFSINAVEKLPPIIEQVQAKVNFDLNGGYLGEDANDDNAKKPITKIAPLNENYRYNVDKETNFPTTELNKNYKANAFEGDNRRMVDDGSGKQVMASHTDQPLGTETYKSMFDKYNEELKKRLTEAQALPTGAGAPNAIRNAAISEAQQDIASFKVYVEKFYTSKGIDITKSQLWLREFPGKESQKDLKTENPKMDNKEFYGWTTKKVDTVDGYNKLQELTTEEQAKDTTNAYKFTENSPILSEMTVYAFYGPLRSQVTNPKQTYDQDDDKQYIEIAPEEGKNLPKNASYKLVKKNDDGSYTEVKGTSQTTTKDGRLVLDITDLPSDKFDPKEDYYIEATEVGKAPSYSTKPIKIDKVAPSFGEANKNMTIEQDAYGYQVKISAKASDDSGILRVYESENKDSGYYDKNASLKSADLNKHIYQQNGEDKTYSVIAIDKFGNKTTVKKSVEKKAEPLQLNADVPYEGDDFIYVSSEEGADIKIEVLNSDDSKAFEINTNLAYGDAEIDTLNDGSTFEFERGQTVIITASKGGKTAKLTLEVD